jgi:hypothetical protein
VIYRDNNSDNPLPTSYDPGAVSRVKNFVQSYLLGRSHGDMSTGGNILDAFSFNRSAHNQAQNLPKGEAGRVLNDLRNLLVDVLCNTLTLTESARRSAAIERRQCRTHVEELRLQAAVHAKRLASSERSKRKKIERETKQKGRDMKSEMEATIQDRVVGYETKCKELEDELSTLRMELSYMKGESERVREEHENALEYGSAGAKRAQRRCCSSSNRFARAKKVLQLFDPVRSRKEVLLNRIPIRLRIAVRSRNGPPSPSPDPLPLLRRYSQYRSRADAEAMNVDTIAALKQEIARRDMNYAELENEMRDRLEASKQRLLEQAGMTEKSYQERIDQLQKDAAESEARRREQEKKAKQVRARAREAGLKHPFLFRSRHS